VLIVFAKPELPDWKNDATPWGLLESVDWRRALSVMLSWLAVPEKPIPN
jgi:hypothetical protein